MRGSFLFNIEIKNKQFNTGVKTTAKTARITFVDNHENIQQITEYGVVDALEIYALIEKGEDINLDSCYVNNFSVSEFKSIRGIEEAELVELLNFSATNSFFEADDTIDFSLSKFIGEKVSFQKACFGNGNVSFLKSKFTGIKKIDFSYSFFGKGHSNFQYSNFGDGNLTFEFASNIGDLSFVNTSFGDGDVNFKSVSFGDGLVEFHFSKFNNGHVSFYKSTFEGKRVDFRKVEFGNGKLDFRRVDFGNAHVFFDECESGIGKVSFKRARFGNGNLSFNLAIFKSSITFENAEFGNGNVSFFKAKLNEVSFKSCHLNNYLDLRIEKCNLIDLSDTVVRDIIDLKKGFSKVDIKQLNIKGLRNLGKIILDWKANEVERLIESQEATSFEKSEQYRILKENFRASGQYEDEDEAYVKFKRNELRYLHSERLKEGGFTALWAYPAKWGEQLLFDKMGKYATKPFRVLVSMFIIYVMFSLVYLLMIHTGHGDLKPGFDPPEQMSELSLSFYHSAITFLTIGYGDYSPWGVIRIISSFEGFVGLFMMSYFTVAFVRKILR